MRKAMTRSEIERFAVGYPYPTDWVEAVLLYFDFDTEKASDVLLSSEKTKDVVNNTTGMESGITECCGYDFGTDGFGKVKVKYCPLCGKRIIKFWY